MKAGAKPAIRTVVNIGDTVWFADRRNGRITEHIAKVAAVKPDGSLTLQVNDQGTHLLHMNVKEWVVSDKTTHGWWKARS